MTAGEGPKAAAGCNAAKNQEALIAAFREGLGLVAIVMRRDPAGIRFVVDSAEAELHDIGLARWWCRQREEAERIAAAATTRLARRARRHSGNAAGDITVFAADAIAAAAERLAVRCWSDADVADESAAIIARVDAEFARLQAAGEMKPINKSYRDERLAAAARGEKIAPYAQWISKYRQNLVRRLAATLRYS